MKGPGRQGQEGSGQMTAAKGVLGEHHMERAMLRNHSNCNSGKKTFCNAKVVFVKDKTSYPT